MAVQLVRFVGDPQPADFLRLELGDAEGRQSYHIRLDQGQALVDAVTTILSQAHAGTSTSAAEQAGSGREPGP
ncbi:hypothetical protein E0H26_25360 [Micromonospora zingiberis]|uniref:Uncharacterized protein n=1 Tax=Micromonospora zingiberis TaxID=2053011 RepID=A0A4R0G8K5_9ACTN|nr:hypothetical protein [Micromonospora zingiberis]TCB91618.1 hypothetical protein E0H26_25360 [Micromonospora zingiberis]